MITINGNTIINVNTVDKTDVKHLRNSKELKEIKKQVKIRDGAVIYCDPPYRNKRKHYFVNKFDYDAFTKWVETNKNKYDIYISEYKENISAWPSSYEVVWEKESCQEMSKRKKTTEVLIHAR